MPENAFKENVVVLTGASSGIGRAVALKLAAQGAWLALAARRTDELKSLADECRQLGGRCMYVTTDVTSQADCQKLVDGAVQEFRRVDTLINNAGVTMWARFDELQTLEPLHTIMETNYFGSVYCTHAALPHLKKSRGRIVQISSLTGKAGVPTRSGYAASKHAMVGFFDSLRIELADSGVTVTSVYPDFVRSEARGRAFGKDGKPIGASPVHEDKIMTTEECASLIINAAARRKRDEILGLRGKVGQWLLLIAPGLVDRIALNAIQKGR